MNWDDLRFLLAVAREGSASGAARDLGVNQSTVFRRISDFEAANKVRVFDRSRDGYTPTQAAGPLLEKARLIEQAVGDIERDVISADEKLEGVIRFSTPQPLASRVILPCLLDFRKAHPGIRLDVDVSNEVLDLYRREADVVLRASNAPTESLFGRRLATVRFAPYATEELAQRAAKRGLKELPWIQFITENSGGMMSKWSRENTSPEHAALMVDDVELAAAAAGEGVGVTLLPCFVGDQEPGLERVGPILDDVGLDIWLLTHEGLRSSRRISVFMGFVADYLSALAPRFEGKPT